MPEPGFVYGLESSQKNEAGNHQVLLQCKKWLIRLWSGQWLTPDQERISCPLALNFSDVYHTLVNK